MSFLVSPLWGETRKLYDGEVVLYGQNSYLNQLVVEQYFLKAF